MATPNILQETQERNKQDVNVAVASEDAPAFTEERSVPLSVDRQGRVRVVLDEAVGGGLYDYTSEIKLQDDFMFGTNSSGTLGSLGWNLSGGAVSYQASVENHIGIVRRTTSAVSGTVSFTSPQGAGGGIPDEHAYTVTFVVRSNNADAETTLRVGVMDDLTSAPTDGIYFERLAADTNWFCVTRASSTETRTDTGVAGDTNWHTFTIERTATSAIFTLDGTVESTQTTNLSTSNLIPAVQMTNTAAADKSYDIDYAEITIEVTR
jgi:hypothetical protein